MITLRNDKLENSLYNLRMACDAIGHALNDSESQTYRLRKMLDEATTKLDEIECELQQARWASERKQVAA